MTIVNNNLLYAFKQLEEKILIVHNINDELDDRCTNYPYLVIMHCIRVLKYTLYPVNRYNYYLSIKDVKRECSLLPNTERVPVHGKFDVFFLAERKKAECPSCTFNHSQLKITNMPKWHILG